MPVYLPLYQRDHRHDGGTGWNGAIWLLVVLGVIGVGHAAATAASPLHTANITCTPGVRSIAGAPARVFCGPAKASVKVGSATYTFAGGACLKQPRFSVNLGTLSFDPGAKAPYFGLSLPRARAGTYAGKQVTLSFTAGTQHIALATRAERGADGWELTGRKFWITNGAEAGVFIVFANVDPSKGYKGITAFIVEREFPGFSVGKKENKLGIRASSTTELILEQCQVPEANVLGPIGQGYKIAIETLNEGRIGIGAQMLGVGQAALDASVRYATERVQFGKRLSEFQAMRFQLADAATLNVRETAHVIRTQMNGRDWGILAILALIWGGAFVSLPEVMDVHRKTLPFRDQNRAVVEISSHGLGV
jgi:hypothetical protein